MSNAHERTTQAQTAHEQNETNELAFPASLGELFEANGFPRLVGRVLGELLLAEPPHLSTAQLCERIGTSKSHLSSAITVLEVARMIDRFGVQGTRQHHYRLREDAFARSIQSSVEPSRALAEMADRACAEVPEGSRAHAQLTRMRDFYLFMTRRYPELLAEFEAGAR
jgi:DNA-binding transcriptional regulator GbsR (MarR family)